MTVKLREVTTYSLSITGQNLKEVFAQILEHVDESTLRPDATIRLQSGPMGGSGQWYEVSVSWRGETEEMIRPDPVRLAEVLP